MRNFTSPPRKEKKTQQRSVKVLMLFMNKTWYIKTFTTATEACVSRVAAEVDFHLCQLIWTVGCLPLPPRGVFSLCSRRQHNFRRQTLQPEVKIHVIFRVADTELLILDESPYISEWRGSGGAAFMKHNFKSPGRKKIDIEQQWDMHLCVTTIR